MPLYEVEYVPDAGSWGVYDGDFPLTAEDTKRAAKSFAKTNATPGDTIQVFTKDGWLDDEYLVDDDGELVSAGIGGGGGGNSGGYGGGLFGGGNGGGGGGGLFGGW